MNRAEVDFASGAVRETHERDQCPKENAEGWNHYGLNEWDRSVTRISEAKILQDNARSLRLNCGPGIVGDASLDSAPGADLSLSAGILSLNNATSISISLFPLWRHLVFIFVFRDSRFISLIDVMSSYGKLVGLSFYGDRFLLPVFISTCAFLDKWWTLQQPPKVVWWYWKGRSC